MRMFIVAAGLLALPLAGTLAQDGPRCRADPSCGGDYPLRVAVAAVPGTPLTWSPARADLEPPPIGRAPILFGRTIPLGELIGRRVRPLGRLPEPVMFNKPMAELGPNDPGLVLMPIGPAPRSPALRRAY